MKSLEENFIIKLASIDQPSEADYLALQREFAKKYKNNFCNKDALHKAYQNLLKSKIISRNTSLENIVRLKGVRSQSGIAVVSVLTKPYPCSGNCIYCPTEPGVPKSYLSSEPAVMRAIANKYHPFKQTQSRLKALSDTGHLIDKISIRIIGGTWSDYPKKYREWFIGQLFKACNEFNGNKSDNLTISELHRLNETAKCRIVELSIETRQDRINKYELWSLRKLGITKVELGVQSLSDKVLLANLRGSTVQDTIDATKLLKEFGFKVSYQMMLNMHESTQSKDIQVFKKLFMNDKFRPDHLKIYPLALVKNCELYKIYLKSKFKPYSQKTLIDVIARIKTLIPRYCRIERVIRDIPASNIVEGGSKISNLRQEVTKKLEANGLKCNCIRCREIKNLQAEEPITFDVTKYQASSGEEYFIETKDANDRLLGFCRLRINNKTDDDYFSHTAIIREIHVYGPTVSVGQKSILSQQHHGYGKKMVEIAEAKALQLGARKIMVIAGVGVRDYFRRQNYTLENTYMVKNLSR